MKNKSGLLAALEYYSNTEAYPLHMPGHKRNTNMLGDKLPYNIDITEINGFDDLHDPHDILREISDKCRKLYHADSAFLLVNGSTCGILAAITSVTHRGDSIIIARNCHKSVYNACALSELDTRFVYPPMDKNGLCGSLPAESVASALCECPSAKAVVITSPTYEGVISDIETIASVCRQNKTVLIVDAAHGAHLPFCSFGKKYNPNDAGADIVITSLHKTLPSMTQTAAAFINGRAVSREKFASMLGTFETSSPSYVLLSSIDQCLDFIISNRDAFAKYEETLKQFSQASRGLKNLKILCAGTDTAKRHGFFSFDKGKIVILTSNANITGTQLMQRLREEYSLELEMAYPTYALAMTSVCDSPEGLSRLSNALLEIDASLTMVKNPPAFPPLPKPMRIRMTNREIDALPDIDLTREQASSGRYISRRSIFAYPPGIPIITPGEIVGSFEYDYIEMLRQSGVNIKEI